MRLFFFYFYLLKIYTQKYTYNMFTFFVKKKCNDTVWYDKYFMILYDKTTS